MQYIYYSIATVGFNSFPLIIYTVYMYMQYIYYSIAAIGFDSFPLIIYTVYIVYAVYLLQYSYCRLQ